MLPMTDVEVVDGSGWPNQLFCMHRSNYGKARYRLLCPSPLADAAFGSGAAHRVQEIGPLEGIITTMVCLIDERWERVCGEHEAF